MNTAMPAATTSMTTTMHMVSNAITLRTKGRVMVITITLTMM